MSHLQSRYLVTLTVGGVTRTFMAFSGGNVRSEATTSRPPGREYPRAIGGEKTLEPVTIAVDYDPAVYDENYVTLLRRNVGVEDAATVGRRKLDANRNPFGKETYVGMISDVNVPESDTNTDNEKAVLEITVQPSGVA